MGKRLHVRHLLIYQIHDLVEGLEHIQAFEIFRLRDLRVERGVEVEDRRVHAADLKEFLALEAGLGQGLLELALANPAPGADGIGKDVDIHGGSSRAEP